MISICLEIKSDATRACGSINFVWNKSDINIIFWISHSQILSIFRFLIQKINNYVQYAIINN